MYVNISCVPPFISFPALSNGTSPFNMYKICTFCEKRREENTVKWKGSTVQLTEINNAK